MSGSQDILAASSLCFKSSNFVSLSSEIHIQSSSGSITDLSILVPKSSGQGWSCFNNKINSPQRFGFCMLAGDRPLYSDFKVVGSASIDRGGGVGFGYGARKR